MVSMSAVLTDAPLDVTVEDARTVAARFAADIRREFGPRLRGIRLYGSAARGDWSPESDIDILVLLDHVSDDDGERIVNRAVALGVLGSGMLIQPIFMNEADFVQLRNRERLFALEVDREGVAL
jgi:hypothetical protein